MKNLNLEIIEELIFENVEKLNDPKIISEIDKTFTEMIIINHYWIFEEFFKGKFFKAIYTAFKDWKILLENNNEDELRGYQEQFTEDIKAKIINIIKINKLKFLPDYD